MARKKEIGEGEGIGNNHINIIHKKHLEIGVFLF
jgi:hypothetical protein